MKLEIYGRESCPWCIQAKTLAAKLKEGGYIDGFQYIDYVVEGIPVSELSKIAKVDVKTVPVILLDGVYIGGFSDLKSKFSF